ncbi:thioredoxin family protein [sulfur-oxidizing endosymbiont of Gigantopelta aegis]|uniref:thioredoxin family protein n=1 Tax=sulfur-oxidizing endosymbiont of Gigantopelta aegis TaxID=2794934 RepID=UPI0031B57ED9
MADVSSFNDYFKAEKKSQLKESVAKKTARPNIKTEKFIHKSDDLAGLIKSSKKPVMLLFEQGSCLECDELHGNVFRRLPVFKQLKQFTIAQVDITSDKKIIGPKGQSVTQKELATMLDVQYTPSMLFYEAGSDKVVFRSDAYLKTFHVQALFDYVLTQEYLKESEFQRFVQRRADRMREEGQEVDLWD